MTSSLSLQGIAFVAPKSPQPTRYLKVVCDCCGWQARVTAKHLGVSGGVQRTLNCPVPYCEGELERAQ